MLSASRTVAALLVAPLGALIAHLAVTATMGDLASVRGSLLAALLVAVVAGVAGLVLVLPVLLLAPRLRLVAWWAAAPWGAAVALLVTMVMVGPSRMTRLSATAMATLGAASGLTYSIAARVLEYKQRAV